MNSNTPDPQQAQRLARVLLDQPAAADCAACLDGLEGYVEAQLSGQTAAAQFPRIASHLDACVDCAVAYALLYDVRRLGDQLPEPPAIPRPDLGFLPGRSDPESLARALGGALSRRAGRLRLALSQSLLDLARPGQPALAFRSGAQAPIFELDLAAPAPEVARLLVTGYAQAEGLVTVRAQVSLPGREWPDLAGAAVWLEAAGARRQGATDAWGEVVFEDVPAAAVATLAIEVSAPAAPPTSA